MEYENFCSICREIHHPSPLRTIACGHQFHRDCIGQWLVHHNNCPLCRFTLGFIRPRRLIQSANPFLPHLTFTPIKIYENSIHQTLYEDLMAKFEEFQDTGIVLAYNTNEQDEQPLWKLFRHACGENPVSIMNEMANDWDEIWPETRIVISDQGDIFHDLPPGIMRVLIERIA